MHAGLSSVSWWLVLTKICLSTLINAWLCLWREQQSFQLSLSLSSGWTRIWGRGCRSASMHALPCVWVPPLFQRDSHSPSTHSMTSAEDFRYVECVSSAALGPERCDVPECLTDPAHPKQMQMSLRLYLQCAWSVFPTSPHRGTRSRPSASVLSSFPN